MHPLSTSILKLTLFFLCIVIFTHTTFAQSSLSGTLRSKQNNTPISGATVSLLQNGLHDHTNSNGRFSFKNVRLPDSLRVSSIGYQSKTIYVVDSMSILQIIIEETPSELEQVIIMGNPLLASQLIKLDVDKTPLNSAQDILRKVPGLFIAQHAGGGKAEQIFLRGFDNDHGTDIAIQVDGLPVNMVSHAHGQGYADLHFIIPETIKDIDFGKGAYYADKGDFNTSGYVSISTFDHLDNNLIKVEGGSFNTMRAIAMINLLGKEAKNKNAYIASEFNYSDGPFDSRQNLNRTNFFSKYNQWINPKQYIGFQASTFSSGWNASGQIPELAVAKGLISRWGSIDPTEGGSTSRKNIAIAYKNFINEDSKWESNFFYSQYKFNLFSNFTFFLNDPVYGDEIQQTDDREIYGFDHKYSHNYKLANSNLTWFSGVGTRIDDIKTLRLSHVYHRDSLLNRLSDVSAFEVNIHAYINLDWQFGKWAINPALRVDHFIFNLHDHLQSIPVGHNAQANRVSPKLNFVYNQNNNIQYYLKSGMGFHSNDVRVVIDKNGRNILPYSLGGDFGAVLRPIHNMIIQPAIWYLFLENEFVYVGDEAVVEESGKTRRLGVDLSLRYQPFKWLYIDGDINYAHARAIEEPKGENYIPLVPSLTSTGGVSLMLTTGLSANLRYRYMKSKPATEDNSIIAKGYFVNDLMLAYGKKNWELTAQAQNLFNIKWNEAQFETETRLRNETMSVSDLCYTPGTPIYLKVGASIKI